MSTEWAQMAHALYLEALMAQTDWSAGEIAFHGGTSLRLSWNSARYSEDLDFLLSRKVKDLDKIAKRVEATMGEMARRIDAGFVIEMKDKTKDIDRMPTYMLSVSHPAFVGKAKIKAEFWRTEEGYLENYPTQLRTPNPRSASVALVHAPGPAGSSFSGSTSSRIALPLDLFSIISSAVPAATLETAYADKLVTFATRPFLKWRDIYDLWWIGTQTSAVLEMDAVCRQFLHNITAYTPPDGLLPHQALEQFLAKDKDAVIRQADPDLKNWLPANIWARFNPHGVEQMVDYVRHSIETVSGHLVESDRSGIDLKSPAAAPAVPDSQNLARQRGG